MTFAKFGKVTLWTLVTIAVIVDIFYIVYHFTKTTDTVGVNYIGSQISTEVVANSENSTDEELELLKSRTLFTFNLYDNANKNGIVLGEMQFNYFTSYNLSVEDYRSSGVQLVENLPFSLSPIKTGYNENSDSIHQLIEYDTTDGLSWNGKLNNNMTIATGLSRDKKYYVRIGDDAYQLQLTGTYTTKEHVFLWIEKDVEYNYTYYDIFSLGLLACQTNSNGEGTCYINLDLSKYFTIKKFDKDSKQFIEGSYVDVLNTYAVVEINYSKNGATNKEQSLFKIIANNSSYGLTKTDIDTTYHDVALVYNITESQMTSRYSEIYGGNFVSIDIKKITELSKMPSTQINLIIDLDKDIVGVDYNGFQNLNINSVCFTSKTDKTIYILDKAFDNTSLKTLKRSKNITLDVRETAFSNEYEEVVV